LPSPNGAELSLLSGDVPLIAGSLRNAAAVAKIAMQIGKRISVVPAGERWEDKSLRPSFEDLVGAGAIISMLKGTRSPEATAAANAFYLLPTIFQSSYSIAVQERIKTARV